MTRPRELNRRHDTEINTQSLTLLLDRIADEFPHLNLRCDADELQRVSGRYVGMEH